MTRVSEAARDIGRSCWNYCSTRFPTGHNTPAHPIDAEWFADAAQKVIDGVLAEAPVSARPVGNAVFMDSRDGSLSSSFGCESPERAAFVAEQFNAAANALLWRVADLERALRYAADCSNLEMVRDTARGMGVIK